jgi:hypothetical protein
MRRLTFQPSASISTISSDLLHATKTDSPVADGCAHVGEQETSPALGGSIPCPLVSCFAPVPAALCAEVPGAPVIPISRPFVKRKCREAFNVWVSISTSMSSIMQAE